MIGLLLVALLQTADAPAPASQTATPPTEHVQVLGQNAAREDEETGVRAEDRVYCRTEVVTDSRVREQRMCQSARQRRQVQEAFQRALDDMFVGHKE
jgi:hypothetical protein